MKNQFLVWILLLLIVGQSSEALELMVEGKGAWFHPTGKKQRKHDGNGGIYGGEITLPLNLVYFCDGLALFTSADYYSKKHPCKKKGYRDFRRIPFAIGFKYFFPLTSPYNWMGVDSISSSFPLELYFGAGLEFNFVKAEQRHHQKRSRTGYGAVYKVGGVISLPHDWFLDFFVNYSDCRVRLKDPQTGAFHRRTDLSAWMIGAGIGYDFEFDNLCCY
jgi:outer membrane protein W